MKAILSIALAATLASANPHRHAHHHHAKREANKLELEKRATVTKVEEVVVYVMSDGTEMSPGEAEKCIEIGACVVIGESGPDVDSSTQAKASAGVFKEDSATTTSSSSQAKVTVASSGGSADGAGVDVEFPSGVYECGTVPGGFGAIAAPWRGMGGWLGLQWGHSSIATGVKGQTCSPGAYCSYLCPEGYQKSQWPSRQGDSGESIGGLFCNDDNKLELTRPESKTLCMKGQGGVYVKNTLSETVFVCRTDYPGTESMVIPIEVAPGTEHEITNPEQSTYMWKGMKTTAQYYINPKGLGRDDACVWDSPALPKGAGDKAPTNFGTGMDGGVTYFGLFPNSAVSSAVLDYNVRIETEGKEVCKLENGVYSGSSSGCTGAAAAGKKVLMTFY